MRNNSSLYLIYTICNLKIVKFDIFSFYCYNMSLYEKGGLYGEISWLWK